MFNLNKFNNAFNNFFNKKGTGALIDTRTEKEKEKDYKFEEIVASINPVYWHEKKIEEWKKYPIFDQGKSNACVAFSVSKILGILYYLKNNNFVAFSSAHIYQKRINKPNPGMLGINALDIAREGVTLEVLLPSQNLNDEEIDNLKIEKYKEDVGKIFKINNYVLLPVKDIDLIASTIQTTQKGIMVWFYFKLDEWNNIEPTIKYPNLNLYSETTLRHSVVAVDFTIWKNKKALIIEDSWGINFGIKGQRIITEDFYKERNFFAAYPINFVFEENFNNKINHKFLKDLKFGDKNEDVKILQDILKKEGLFPSNVDSTGYYGIITAKAVYKWQVKYLVDTLENLNKLEGKIFGVKSRERMNMMYGN